MRITKCYCCTIGVMVEQLLIRQQERKCIKLNCPMLEWEIYKTQIQESNLLHRWYGSRLDAQGHTKGHIAK